jgi:hypothetical protein
MKKPANRSPDRGQPRSYVIRIYRQTTRGVVGQVEDVSSGAIRPFATAQQLWQALCRPAG